MSLTSTSRLPLVLACGGSFLAFIDVTIANLAVPSLAAAVLVPVVPAGPARVAVAAAEAA